MSPLQFLVIMQLSEESKYGYEMLKVLRDEFEGLWDLKTGTFYPALKSLESKGFVKTEIRDKTEFYSLTEKGTTLLESLGGRMEAEYKFTDAYFKTMMRWMPLDEKKEILANFLVLMRRNLSQVEAVYQGVLNEGARESSSSGGVPSS